MAIYAITALLQLSRGDIGFLYATAFAAGIYYFVYRNLRTDLATAKIGTLVAAIGAGIFWLLNMFTGQVLFATINVVALVCLVFVFNQLLKLEKLSPVTTVGVAPADAAEKAAKLHMLDELRKSGGADQRGIREKKTGAGLAKGKTLQLRKRYVLVAIGTKLI
jgi:hypothetical protein